MAIEVEEIAKIVHFAMCRGEPILLSDEDVQATMGLYHHTYGQHPDRRPAPSSARE
jgi:hypothetical protein